MASLHQNNRRAYRTPKPFLTYEQQIENLSKDKHLVINNIPDAIQTLENISYYALIGGYKDLFYNPMTRTYKSGTTFEDILSLYEFDDALRDLLFHYIRIIEQEIRSHVSYHFTETYGESQSAYLDRSNYVPIHNSRADVDKLIRILDNEANRNTERPYIVHQRNTYGNVPLWVLVKTLTLGQISRMYSLLPAGIKTKVSKHFPGVTELDLTMHLRVLTHFRNVCAHNERLYSYYDRYDIPDTLLHVKLGIPKNGQQYVCGKKDLFAVVISLRYLLPRQEFASFKRRLSVMITRLVNNSDNLVLSDLLASMGFPENWKNISQYKI